MTQQQKYKKVTEAIIEKGKEILPRGSKIILFGSRARGDAREDSDWDLLILVPGPERLPLSVKSNLSYPFIEMGWDINEEINPIVHSFDSWNNRKCIMLYYNIREEGKVIWD